MRIRPVTMAVFVIGLGLFVGPGFARQPQTRAFGPPTAPPAAPQRHALVVGNDAYPGASALRNAVADAVAVEAALRDLGMRVEVVRNATQEIFERAVDRFVANVQPGDMALFYYSGHGLEARGENYLLPVDFAALDEVQVKRRAIAAGEIEERLHERGAGVRILVLDACRDNPYRGVRSGAGGLVAMAQARGALIAFATAPDFPCFRQAAARGWRRSAS